MAYDLIKNKRAIRNFLDKPVPPEIIEKIMNSGRLAQSSKNSQTWKFIVVQERDRLEKLSRTGDWTTHVKNAAFAAILVNTGGWDFDLGQASANMQLVAEEHGIGSCLAYFQRQDEAKEILGVPKEYPITIAISFGYPDRSTPRQLPPTVGRRSYADVVSQETW